MKKWRTCLSMGVLLGVTAAGASGCDKMVHTTVIAEQVEENRQEQSLVPADAGNVSEQVKAPEKYTVNTSWDQVMLPLSGDDDLPKKEAADIDTGYVIQGDGTALENSSTDEKNVQMITEESPEDLSIGYQGGAGLNTLDQHLTLIADALIEVPDVETIRLKKVNASVLSDETMEAWAEVLCGGEGTVQEEKDGVVEGKATVNQLPYTYSYSRSSYQETGDENRARGLCFFLQTDWDSILRTADGLENAETGERITGTAKTPEDCQREAEKLLQTMGLSEFISSCYVSSDEVTYGWQSKENENTPISQITLVYERTVEEIPVTGTFSVEYPMYQDGVTESAEESNLWGPEFLELTYMEGRLMYLTYTGPVEISDYSDEDLFLLPFEEIRQIFENTIGEKMTGCADKEYGAAAMAPEQLREVAPVWLQYPDAGFENIQVNIQKVQLGYMRVREEEKLTPGKEEGILIPVWDFFGTWTAGNTQEDGKTVGEKMENDSVSLLTIDARDGTVIQRMVGY